MDPAPDRPRNQTFKPDQLLPNSAVDEFFLKMKNDLRRPKPSDEAIAEALRAIQTMTVDSTEEEAGAVATASFLEGAEPVGQCPKCSGTNSVTNQFCGFCGASLCQVADRIQTSASADGKASGLAASDRHVHHHHYHHHYFPENAHVEPPAANAAEEVAARQPTQTAPGGETEIALRNLVQSWVLAFNAKHTDHLAALYAAEGILVRPDSAVSRGQSRIRQELEAAIKSGFGDVLLDAGEITMFGEMACVTGSSRMLVPVTPGNRQERTGKFLLLVRHEGGGWKILADSWCLDATPVAAEVARR